MNDPTNWNADAHISDFEFKSIEDAKRGEIVMNRALRESFQNGKNVAFEEAAKLFDGFTYGPYSHPSQKIRDLIQRDAAHSQTRETK